MGFFSGLDIEAYDRQYSDRQLVERIGSYFRPHAVKLLWVSFYLVLIAFLSAAVPLLTSRLVDLLGADLSNQEIWIVASAVFASGFQSNSAFDGVANIICKYLFTEELRSIRSFAKECLAHAVEESS